jgi:hypothetical protein
MYGRLFGLPTGIKLVGTFTEPIPGTLRTPVPAPVVDPVGIT